MTSEHPPQPSSIDRQDANLRLAPIRGLKGPPGQSNEDLLKRNWIDFNKEKDSVFGCIYSARHLSSRYTTDDELKAKHPDLPKFHALFIVLYDIAPLAESIGKEHDKKAFCEGKRADEIMKAVCDFWKEAYRLAMEERLKAVEGLIEISEHFQIHTLLARHFELCLQLACSSSTDIAWREDTQKNCKVLFEIISKIETADLKSKAEDFKSLAGKLFSPDFCKAMI